MVQKYRPLIDGAGSDVSVPSSSALGPGWKSVDKVPEDLMYRRMRYLESKKALGEKASDFETWRKSVDLVTENRIRGRLHEDRTLSQLGVTNNNYRYNYTTTGRSARSGGLRVNKGKRRPW